MSTTLLPNFSEEEQKILKEQLNTFLKQATHFFDKGEIEAIAKETEFVERDSKLTGHIFLSIFMFGVNIYGNPSLEQLIGLFKLYLPDITISRQGLHERINEEAVEFFKRILALSINLAIPESLNCEL